MERRPIAKGIVIPLFSDQLFADVSLFWPLQDAEIAGRAEAYMTVGWGSPCWNQPTTFPNTRKAPNKKGGRVNVAITHSGDVESHEGHFLEESRARQRLRRRLRWNLLPQVKAALHAGKGALLSVLQDCAGPDMAAPTRTARQVQQLSPLRS